LQSLSASLGQNELYERLLCSFARREVTKHEPGRSEREVARAVEDELRRLSIVAFAMFNRNGQWVTEADLAADLRAVYGDRQPVPAAHDLRAPLGSAEIVLGRFFFVHRARAVRDDTPLQTYEFLHATFGEYLVARLTLLVLRDMVVRDAATTLSMAIGRIDDDFLHAMLSYASLAVRAPIVGFLTDLMSTLAADERAAIVDLVTRLFRVAHQPQPPRAFDRYQPQPVGVPVRHAAYSANLVLLAVCAAGRIRGRELYGPGVDAATAWCKETLLWRSQLNADDEFGSFVNTIAVERIFDDDGKDVALSLRHTPTAEIPTDLYWTYDIRPDDPRRHVSFGPSTQQINYWRRRANFMCRQSDDVTMHALEPMAQTLPALISTYINATDGSAVSGAHVLMRAWLHTLGEEPASQAYRQWTDLIYRGCAAWDQTTRAGCAVLLLDALTVDQRVDTETVAHVMTVSTVLLDVGQHPMVRTRLVRCGLRFLDNETPAGRKIATFVSIALGSAPRTIGDDPLAVEAWLRLTESGITHPLSANEVRATLASLPRPRPDLEARLRSLTDGVRTVAP